MPQMSPLWWSSLYFMFSILFLLSIILVFFSLQLMTNPSTPSQSLSLKINWKW